MGPVAPRPADLESSWTTKILSSEPTRDSETKGLLKFLLDDKVQVASLSLWEPMFGSSTLRFGNKEQMENYTIELKVPARAGREDRKYGYKLPLCEEENDLVFSLLEPNLEWLGVHVDGICSGKNPTRSKYLEWRVNGQAMEIPSRPSLGIMSINNWVNVSTEVEPATVYNVSFCNKDKTRPLQFCQLVGAMRPQMQDSGQ